MQRVHPELEQQNRDQVQIQNQKQIQVNFRVIFYFFYFLMLYIAINIVICAISANENQNYIQILYFCSFEIVFLFIIICCILYFNNQLINIARQLGKMDAQSLNEINNNKTLYESTLKFIISYLSQSKFLWIKIILFYSSLGLLMLITQLSQSYLSICICYNSEQNQYQQKDYSEFKCSLDENCKIDEQKTNSFFFLNEVAQMNWPLVIFLIAFEFISFLLTSPFCFINQFRVQEYQYNYNNIQPQNSKDQGSFICGAIVFHSFSKLISLSIIMIITSNENCYVLASSNIFYHLIMILMFNQIRFIIIQHQPLEEFCYQNFQILMDSILLMQNSFNKVFRIALVLCLIFTIVGKFQFKRTMKSTDIINFDFYIEFDCWIFQFIQLTLLIYRYIFYPKWNKKAIVFNQIYNASSDFTNGQISFHNQSTTLNTRINTQNNQNNIQSYYFMVSQLSNSAREINCVICLEQLSEKSNNIVQLKCHHLHLFHQECILQWLRNHTVCPTCNKDFDLG